MNSLNPLSYSPINNEKLSISNGWNIGRITKIAITAILTFSNSLLSAAEMDFSYRASEETSSPQAVCNYVKETPLDENVSCSVIMGLKESNCFESTEGKEIPCNILTRPEGMIAFHPNLLSSVLRIASSQCVQKVLQDVLKEGRIAIWPLAKGKSMEGPSWNPGTRTLGVSISEPTPRQVGHILYDLIHASEMTKQMRLGQRASMGEIPQKIFVNSWKAFEYNVVRKFVETIKLCMAQDYWPSISDLGAAAPLKNVRNVEDFWKAKRPEHDTTQTYRDVWNEQFKGIFCERDPSHNDCD